jgi:hypothetical protein
MEQLARQQYATTKDPHDCALLYVALGKRTLLQGLFRSAGNKKASAPPARPDPATAAAIDAAAPLRPGRPPARGGPRPRSRPELARPHTGCAPNLPRQRPMPPSSAHISAPITAPGAPPESATSIHSSTGTDRCQPSASRLNPTT